MRTEQEQADGTGAFLTQAGSGDVPSTDDVESYVLKICAVALARLNSDEEARTRVMDYLNERFG